MVLKKIIMMVVIQITRLKTSEEPCTIITLAWQSAEYERPYLK